MNKIETRVPRKLSRGIIGFLIIFLMLDCLATCYAQDVFITKMVIENDIETEDLKRREENYKKLEENEHLTKFINMHWNDEKMIKTFPNMKIEDKNGNIIYLNSLLPEIQPYYRKLFDSYISDS